MKIFNNYNDLYTFTKNNPLLRDEFDTLKEKFQYYSHLFPDGFFYICLETTRGCVEFALLLCESRNLAKLTKDPKGTILLHKINEHFKPYVRAQLIFENTNSVDFLYSIINRLITYVDIIVIKTYSNTCEKIYKILENNYKLYIKKALPKLSIILPASNSELLQKFNSKKHHQYNKNNLNRIIKRLEKEYHTEYYFCNGSIPKEILKEKTNDIFLILSNSWQFDQMGNSNLFNIIHYLNNNNQLLILITYANTVPVSFVVGSLRDNVVTDYWTAYNQEYFRYSVGKITFIKFLYKCIEMKINKIFVGDTIHKYKIDLVNCIQNQCEINIFNENSYMGKVLKHAIKINPDGML